ncbi:MAG: hypothetical protein H0W84_13950 [Bacteroidetes bacterium]|nr:hypothetical protein [Bacteroidota bacterium]
MDKFRIRKEISTLIDSIKEHSDNIGDNKHVPQLELELILSKIKKLYERSIVFTYLNSIPDTTVEEATVIVEKTAKPVKEIKAEPSKPADLFGTELPLLVEKPKPEKKAEKPVSNNSNNIRKPVITDLKAAISLNDQFQFVNELFEGSMQEYGIALQQLNAAESLESALDYFGDLQQLYNWDVEREAVKRLVDLIDRRYS